MTESGVAHPLHKLAPGKTSTSFPRTLQLSECPYMRRNRWRSCATPAPDRAPRRDFRGIDAAGAVSLERMLALQ